MTVGMGKKKFKSGGKMWGVLKKVLGGDSVKRIEPPIRLLGQERIPIGKLQGDFSNQTNTFE